MKLASAAKDQAQASEFEAKQATKKLAELVANAEQTTHRLGSVEAVLTQVDLSTGGRKLCMSYRPFTWGNASGDEGTLPLYVPASWSVHSCVEQGTKVQAASFRLGCVFRDHVSMGVLTAILSTESQEAKPKENCGW